MSKNLFIDIETTGLDVLKNGIVQISGIIEIDEKMMEKFNFYIKPFPEDEIDEKALAVSNITYSILLNDKKYIDPISAHSSLSDILSQYVDKFDKKDKFHFIGYNSQAFDFPFLRTWYRKCGNTFFGSWFWSPSIDVMTLWAFLLTQKRNLMTDFKLASLAQYLGITCNAANYHDSMYDSEVTRELFHKAQEYIKKV